MEPYKLILENTLFQFDWGQDETRNHCTSLTKIKLNANEILATDPFTDAIARYHNWFRTFSKKDPAQMLRKDVIAFRQETINVIHTQMVNVMPNHPALRIYNKECQVYDAQDCILLPPLNCVKTRNSSFILLHRTFYTKNLKNLYKNIQKPENQIQNKKNAKANKQ